MSLLLNYLLHTQFCVCKTSFAAPAAEHIVLTQDAGGHPVQARSVLQAGS